MTLLPGNVPSATLNVPVPISAPPYPTPPKTMHWSGISSVIMKYRTDGNLVRDLIPSNLSVEQSPVVTIMFVDYGDSPMGTCHEVIQFVEVVYNGQKYNYSMFLVLDNQIAVYIGREVFGFPKVLGQVDFNPKQADSRNAIRGSCTAHTDTSGPVVESSFTPANRQCAHGPLHPGSEGSPVLNLRLIPSSVPGGPPSVREFVEVDFSLQDGEVWEGDWDLKLPSLADSDSFHKLPVVERLSGHLVRNSTSTVTLGDQAFGF
ncbi:acetoacetate decarboxylase family protein [Aspergillus candidus]|uniref:Decarboxylase DEC1 n=1 Tax=Aspergillus candidus TaxID=41067 RepID=A0A2I2F9C3_ASPCN|nr:decarboxylase DEC1 [Aspergillus candidus]PLB37198.1 decarboxylase DEC1 [Aspergillus candidus]